MKNECWNCGSKSVISSAEKPNLKVCLDCGESFRVELNKQDRPVQVRLKPEERGKLLRILIAEGLIEEEPKPEPEPKPEADPAGDPEADPAGDPEAGEGGQSDEYFG